MTLKIQGQGEMIMTLHNYRSRPVHKTLNEVNPSSSFRDMRSAKSGPNLWQIWQVFGPWASPYGANAWNGQMTVTVTWQCTTTGLDNSTKLWMEKIHQAVTEICVPQVWQPPAHPPELWRQYPSSPKGWGVKMHPRVSSYWQLKKTDRVNSLCWCGSEEIIIFQEISHASM